MNTRYWYDTAEAAPNSTEMLFYALLLIVYNEGHVRALNEWATKVKAKKSAAEEQRHDWQPKVDWGSFDKVSKLFDPMGAAFKGVRGSDNLATIAAAMKLWDGEGRTDELDALNLSHYFHRDIHTVRKTRSKRDGPPRWRSWSIVHMAEFVLKHGVALRKALRLDDMEVEEVPTAHARAMAAEARIIELDSENKKMLAKAKDARRKANERKAEQKASAQARRREQRKAAAAAVKQQVAAQLEKKLEPAKKRLEAEAEADKEKRRCRHRETRTLQRPGAGAEGGGGDAAAHRGGHLGLG